METPPRFEADFRPVLKPSTGQVSLTDFLFPALILGLLTDRIADPLIGWTGVAGRAVCVAAIVALVWRYYCSILVGLAISDTTLEFACARADVRYALADIASVRLSTSSRRDMTISLKTRTGWRRRRYRCRPKKNVLTFEQDLLKEFRARGVRASTTTIVLW